MNTMNKYPQTTEPAEVCIARLENLRTQVADNLAKSNHYPYNFEVKDLWIEYANTINTHAVYVTQLDLENRDALYQHRYNSLSSI